MTALALLLCLPTLLPLGSALLGLLQADRQALQHLFEHVLPQVASNSFWLVLWVGCGCALLGSALAALIALCEFPGRRWLSWLLLLPLALPGYVAAVAFIGLFDYSGPLAVALRAVGWSYWPEFRSLAGVSLTMILVLYPYVYLIARDAFARQGARAMEAARVLGMTPWQAFWRAALPLARPWIAGGSVLVVMETLADFGTVAAFNYDTFTSAIYKAWFALFSIDAALAVAGCLLLLVLALVLLERWSRRGRRYFASVGVAPARLPLGRWRWAASALCLLVLLLGFVLPVTRLLWLAVDGFGGFDARWWQAAWHTLLLAALAAVLTCAAAAVLALAARGQPGRLSSAIERIATLGYGLPGALLAVGLYVPLNRLLGSLGHALGLGSALQGGLALLLLAYGVRFTAVAHTPISAALARVRPNLVDAVRVLGIGGGRLVATVYAPLLRGGMLSAALLVMIDVMKEMPITLMTRPFGWDTLATRVFEYSNEGLWAQAAVPALLIVAVGWLPVLWLERRQHAA